MPFPSTAQGEQAQFVLLPPFGEPGTDALKDDFQSVCKLLKDGFADPYGEASWRGSCELHAYRHGVTCKSNTLLHTTERTCV